MMKTPRHLLPWVLSLTVFLGVAPLTPAAESGPPRERLLLDFAWKFHLGNDWGTGEDLAKAGSSGGPAKRDFADTGWRTVNLPHDWAIELPFDSHADGSHGFKPVGPGYPENSVGWYRRSFDLPKEDTGKRIWLEFDGAYRDSRVFVNGYFVGHHESGYTSFRYDITDLMNCGGKNTVAVRVDASQFEGWFYEGAGIYRHVWLVKTAPVAVVPDGVFVYSSFAGSEPVAKAEIHAEARLHNSRPEETAARVQFEILDAKGQSVARGERAARLAAEADTTAAALIPLRSPVLWSPEHPVLYRLVTTVELGTVVTDRIETEFGVRTTDFDATRGFLLNGQPYVLKGTCNHQDHAGVGAALPDHLQWFRISRLKEMGGNAYRTSHNPPTPELLEACDHLGMLVMDENRLLGSDAANLARLEGLVRRDRNHASVGIWSIANEEGVQTTPTGGRVAETMQNLVHRLDPTRRVTMAANTGNDFGGLNRIIDVRGWNYNIGRGTDDYHAAHPLQPNVGTEQASTVCTRGIYANDQEKGYVSAYDDNAPPWAHTTETWWKFFSARPWLSGGFAWTGFDYRGEPTPYSWPCINSHFGIVDTCGFPKDNFYYYQAWWGDRPLAHLLPHWNWAGHEGQEIDVRCFANGDEAELFLNGTSLGRKTIEKNSHARWKVNYAPGTLAVKSFRSGQPVAEDKVETTGAPAAVRLTPDRPAIRADGEEVSVITAAVVDAQGRVVPLAGNLLHFELQGPGRILGVGNGDPSSHEADLYVTKPAVRSLPLNEWRMKEVGNPKNSPETAVGVEDTQWRKVDTRVGEGPLRPGRSAVFRANLNITAEDLQSREITLSAGMIDDEGWLYVNGQFAGEAHDWSSSPSFPIRRFLREGQNTLAFAIQNREGAGGPNKGVTVEFQTKPAEVDWRRSAFNGLAQIIIQGAKEPGTLALTARAEGLSEAKLALPAEKCVPRPAVN